MEPSAYFVIELCVARAFLCFGFLPALAGLGVDGRGEWAPSWPCGFDLVEPVPVGRWVFAAADGPHTSGAARNPVGETADAAGHLSFFCFCN